MTLYYQSYKENAPYDFDSNQINHLFEKFKIKNILVPHHGLLTEEESAFYLKYEKLNEIETATQILQLLKNGVPKNKILEQFKEKYYDEKVREIYPIDAMELNTNIVINLIEKELVLYTPVCCHRSDAIDFM